MQPNMPHQIQHILASILAVFFLTVTLVGCKMRAPMHTWSPPLLSSAVGKKVAVAPIEGEKEVAGRIQEKLLATAPRDIGRTVDLVSPEYIPQISAIQLAGGVKPSDTEPSCGVAQAGYTLSFTDSDLTEGNSPLQSDIAMASVARDQGYDYILRGELLDDRRRAPSTDPKQSLTLSWQLTAIDSDRGERGCGMPVVVDSETAIDLYPDLAMIADPIERLISAASRESLKLITPSIRREEVTLAVPRFLPGASDVRKGNTAARQGDWARAKRYWNEAAQNHPLQAAATHNLALAHAASQNFSDAKQLARKAIRMNPTASYKRTLVWIETRQRDYHTAFRLPDPPEGWFVTRGNEDQSSEKVVTSVASPIGLEYR